MPSPEELRSGVRRAVPDTFTVYPAAGQGTGFQYPDVGTGAGQPRGGSQPGQPAADDEHVAVVAAVVHGVDMTVVRLSSSGCRARPRGPP
ncbi:hypothetical protein FB471_6064 [Amycolatopsis cihanbeyliensis]|uniref:Uncharacterized protein n=1 Tax=Amycolatopsis cihanbeyliensis TaxID=1128664 RepID=A0A542CSV5_AMYCI|nr:hypothetical protein FB471_6064 [Amycolatopsis cihanbeyliensis]